MGIDLHIHTTCSDGDTSPRKIVELAISKRLRAIAITDHDTIAGIGEAQDAAQKSNMEIVPGVELSVNWQEQAMHLLGYFFDISSVELNQGLQWIREGRQIRNEQILARLVALGCNVSMDELEHIAGSDLIARPHFAQLLVEKRYVRTMEEAFRLYLGAGAKAYVKRRSMSVADAVAMLHRANGVAVVAHPYTLGYQGLELARQVRQMAATDIDGLEVYYPKHSQKFIVELRKLAAEHDLIVTGGSDYHGKIRPGTGLADGKRVFVADYILEELKQRHQRVRARQHI